MITKLLSYSAEAEVLGRTHLVLFEEGKLVIAGLSLEESHSVLRALSLGHVVSAELPQALPRPNAPPASAPGTATATPRSSDAPTPSTQTGTPSPSSPAASTARSAAAPAPSPSASTPAGRPKKLDGFIYWSGTWCGVPGCGKKQYETTSGATCENGHGADPVGPPAAGTTARPTSPAPVGTSVPPAAGTSASSTATAAAAAPTSEASFDGPPKPAHVLAPPPVKAASFAEAQFDDPPAAPSARDAVSPPAPGDRDMPSWSPNKPAQAGPPPPPAPRPDTSDLPPGLVAAKNLKEVLIVLTGMGHKTQESLTTEAMRLKDRLPVLATIADLRKRVHTACSAYSEQFGLSA